MRSLAFFAVLALAVPASAQEIDASTAVSVEVTAERDTWFVGERVRVSVRISYDAAFLERHAVQPFQRELGLPLRLVTPWMIGRDARRRVPWADPVVVAVNDGTWGFGGDAEGVEQGFFFEVVAPEEIDLSATVEMTVATEFREDFVEGRVAVDAKPVRLAFPASTIHVLAVPEVDRPDDFSGGVGEYRISAHVSPADPERPGVIHVSVGVGSYWGTSDVVMPALTGLSGFHVVGSREGYINGGANSGWSNAQLYELEIVDPAVRAIPPIPFSFFDPVNREFRTIYTDPVPLTSEDVPDLPAAAPPTTEDDEIGPATGILVALGAFTIVVLLLVVLLRRRRGDHGGRDAGPAAIALRALGAPDADAVNVLATVLAARLGCLPAAVITPDLARRLVASGTPDDVAHEAATLLERLVAARYGGEPASPDDVVATRSVIERLDRASHRA